MLCASSVLAGPCSSAGNPDIGRVVAAQSGTISHGGAKKRAIHTDDRVCLDSQIVIGDVGLVTIELLDPSAKAANDDRPLITLGPNSSLRFRRPPPDRHWLLELREGLFRFFSPKPTRIDVETPYLTAGVRGTEYVLGTHPSDCVFAKKPRPSKGCSALWVQEGVVVVSSKTAPLFDVNGASGPEQRSVIAYEGETPRKTDELKIHPDDAVNWVVYYPPLVSERWAACDAAPAGSEAPGFVVRCGSNAAFENLLSSIEGVVRAQPDDVIVQAAARLLSQGALDRATRLLDERNRLDPSAGALALRSIIALKQNDRTLALQTAQRAIDHDDGSADAWLALSYVQQANFELPAAAKSTDKAAERAPGEPLIVVRQAELALSQGDTGLALERAHQATGLVPNGEAILGACDASPATSSARRHPTLSRAWNVLGFARLVQFDTEGARSSFGKSLCADAVAPLPQLGLGLAMIRDGEIDEGVTWAARAAAMDPRVSLYRSYLAKAYLAQGQTELADKELDLAKAYDPNDPTPWLYEAFASQAANQLVDALQAVEASIARNDHRGVYRSRLLLDADAAVRLSGLGRTYEQLGFEQLAYLAATESIARDPTDFTAHRLLADANARAPRRGIARVSELLQARLRAPRAQHPVGSQIAVRKLENRGIPLALRTGYHEYSQLFQQDGLKASLSLVGGSQGTLGEELRLSGAKGPASIALTQYLQETDGFRPNNYVKDRYVNLLGQVQLTPNSNIQLEYRNLDSRYGDLFWGFDPDDYWNTDDIEDEIESWRIGGHHVFSTTWDLVAFARREETTPIIDAGDGSYFSVFDDSSNQAEVQWVGRFDNSSLIAGGGLLRRKETGSIRGLSGVFEEGVRSQIRHESAYALWHSSLGMGDVQAEDSSNGKIDLTLGATYSRLDEETRWISDFLGRDRLGLNRERLLPKLGLVLTLPEIAGISAKIRAARFDTLKRPLQADETIEPTHIAGFNQFYDDTDGTLARAWGLGVDTKVGVELNGQASMVFAGASLLRRDLDVVTYWDEFFELDYHLDGIDETVVDAYVNWAPSRYWALALRFSREQFDRKPFAEGPERILDVATERVALGIRYFSPSGWQVNVEPIWIDQRGRFVNTDFALYRGADEFAIVNTAIRYPLPARRGSLVLAIENLFDRRYNYQDADPLAGPLASRDSPERAVYLRATLSF